LATQAVEGAGADYGATHYIQQATHEGGAAPAQVQGKTPRSRTRKQRSRAAREAAGGAEAAFWASLMGEEMEAGQAQEPKVEYDDWHLYYQVMNGNDNYDSR
jgi:hypothetical protein